VCRGSSVLPEAFYPHGACLESVWLTSSIHIKAFSRLERPGPLSALSGTMRSDLNVADQIFDEALRFGSAARQKVRPEGVMGGEADVGRGVGTTRPATVSALRQPHPVVRHVFRHAAQVLEARRQCVQGWRRHRGCRRSRRTSPSTTPARHRDVEGSRLAPSRRPAHRPAPTLPGGARVHAFSANWPSPRPRAGGSLRSEPT